MMQSYETVLIIQSYPTATHLLNNLDKLPTPMCIIVICNGGLTKFLKNFQSKDIKVIGIGSGKVLRNTVLSLIRPVIMWSIIRRCAKIKTNKLIITFRNYSDMSALAMSKIKFHSLELWVPFEEKRYNYKTHSSQELQWYQHKINTLTDKLIERKIYTEKNGTNTGTCVGLNLSHKLFEHVKVSELKQIDFVNLKISNKISPNRPYIILVERELVKSGHLSLLNLIWILITLRKKIQQFELDVYVKFKPRHYYIFKGFVYRVCGFRVLDTRVPAQVFCAAQNCKAIFGFTSSALSIDYGKRFYCLASLENLFKKSLMGNIKSMEERASGSIEHIKFLKNLNELDNLKEI
ncbi:hypothetical protein OAH99_00505 [Planktomarina sp.]|nr:hypothetical protein [Planktomarina sp.]